MYMHLPQVLKFGHYFKPTNLFKRVSLPLITRISVCSDKYMYTCISQSTKYA